ncbi:hypothetical protein LEP1GSC108_1242 [Leptospira weilii str. UI 13098]|uniref:Uncharacterized protein n=1 Tax=Leptospira weilii str. UI 13098 TaxID=1088542 RepID=M6Q841_9LEPT|nr:hypothetical protein LEP1GSC108_1242 [Leptospira weilii str. UI 13098]
MKLTPRRATYLATLRERDLSLGKLCVEFLQRALNTDP